MKRLAPTRFLVIIFLLGYSAALVSGAYAQPPEDEAEALRKAQDPLADV